MTKGSKNNQIAIISTDMPTTSVLSKLDEKINALGKIVDTPYKTNGNLTGFGDVKTITDVSILIKMYSSVSNREKAYNVAAEDLGLKTYPMFTEGGTSEDWKHDIQLRIAIIQHKEQLDKLKEYKERMSKFLSEQDQKELLLKEMIEFMR